MLQCHARNNGTPTFELERGPRSSHRIDLVHGDRVAAEPPAGSGYGLQTEAVFAVAHGDEVVSGGCRGEFQKGIPTGATVVIVGICNEVAVSVVNPEQRGVGKPSGLSVVSWRRFRFGTLSLR